MPSPNKKEYYPFTEVGNPVCVNYKQYIDYGDTSEASFPDSYELNETLETDFLLGKKVAATTNAVCPRCESVNTGFGTGLGYDLMWHCQTCGLLFSIEMKLIFDDIRELDSEVNNG